MIELIAHNLAPIMFAALVLFLVSGYPVAFALAANGLFFFFIGVELAPLSGGEITLSWPLLQTSPGRLLGVMNNETLLAIPFFTFMGIVLEKSGMAEDLLDTVGQLFGPIRGGLAYAVVLVGAVLAATTGVVAASVMAMGLISLPIMLRYGYDRSLATGVIAASGTLAQIIPPSLVLIVLADQLGRSVGDMYAGAIVPGLMLTAIYCLYVFVITIIRPKAAPALPTAARTLGSGATSLLVVSLVGVAIAYGVDRALAETVPNGAGIWGATIGALIIYALAVVNKSLKLNFLSRLAQEVVITLTPPLALIFLVLGTIFLGIATPTEGGAMGAAGALIMALAKRRISWGSLREALDSTTRLSCFVLFILIGARVFSLTFYGVNGHVWVEELMSSLPGGQWGFLIAVNILVFILGCFIDFFEIAFIIIPLLAPVAAKLGIDLIWFGVLLGVNMQTSFLTPPFGFALFYMRSVAPVGNWLDKVTGKTLAGVKTTEIYRGAIGFILLQLIMVAAVMLVPKLVTHYQDEISTVDPSKIEITLPGGEGLEGGSELEQLPSLDLSEPPTME
ncbi:TRAP transporter large permease subunit [Dongia sp.]|jgi:TRAP-type mannitol/chloroaromatic compound transport system permease large subunit|uniref:TRAP transporter large permease n=1 Tax=Dongia sp. TaxID=1977262 RepID=UPI0035AECFE5